MRYIGCKKNLLNFIEEVLIENKVSSGVFADPFTGTTSVAKHFKKRGFRLITNDLLHCSYAFQRTYIATNQALKFSKLLSGTGLIGLNVEKNKNSLFTTPGEVVLGYLNKLQGIKEFFYKNYCSGGTRGQTFQRNYFSDSNAQKIDAIRSKVQEWNETARLSEDEFYFLLTALVEAISFVSNIAGTYGTFLKHYDPRSLKPIFLRVPETIGSSVQHRVFREDANQLISRIEADILYLDPPYNSRQYVPYYHILETATRWDSPAIYGKTGRRPYQEEMSQYCKKEGVGQALSDLIVNAKCNHVLLSYSSDGLLTEKQIREILSLKGDLKVYKRNYRRYKSNGGHSLNGNKGVNELLFYVKVRK